MVNHFMMKWGQHNWEAGFLGYPITDEIVLQNGRRQDFQGGSIYWSPVSLGAIGGAIRDKYHALGAETGPLGYPAATRSSSTSTTAATTTSSTAPSPGPARQELASFISEYAMNGPHVEEKTVNWDIRRPTNK
nr:hypothetical protein [Rhodococcus ruber]